MSYDKIQRYQRMSPDLQTEWGTYANQFVTFNPSSYKYRQPAVPNLARGRNDMIQPRPMGPQGLGYVGEYVPGPMGEAAPPSAFGLGGDTLKTVLIMAAVAAVLYFLFRDKGAKSNPCVSDMNALLGSGWTPPEGVSFSAPALAPKRRRSQTRAGKKSLSRHARQRPRDASGRFVSQ